jgi:hypothetical protein
MSKFALKKNLIPIRSNPGRRCPPHTRPRPHQHSRRTVAPHVRGRRRRNGRPHRLCLPGYLNHLQLLPPPLRVFTSTAAPPLRPSASTVAAAPTVRIDRGCRPAFRIERGRPGYRRHVQH